MTGRLVWVSLPYATFGLCITGGVITAAAPIARWSLGRRERDVANYYRRRGARFQDCSPVMDERKTQPRRQAMAERPDVTIPGWEGSIGPGPGQYGKPHVYARDTGSGAGNCVCGRNLGASVHVAAAPGVPIPDHMR